MCACVGPCARAPGIDATGPASSGAASGTAAAQGVILIAYGGDEHIVGYCSRHSAAREPAASDEHGAEGSAGDAAALGHADDFGDAGAARSGTYRRREDGCQRDDGPVEGPPVLGSVVEVSPAHHRSEDTPSRDSQMAVSSTSSSDFGVVGGRDWVSGVAVVVHRRTRWCHSVCEWCCCRRCSHCC